MTGIFCYVDLSGRLCLARSMDALPERMQRIVRFSPSSPQAREKLEAEIRSRCLSVPKEKAPT